uniref:Uncharacterized protein n=1 Tax=Arundo donax TaxID=35708 RepID=A0A0A9HQT2_ARUDO
MVYYAILPLNKNMDLISELILGAMCLQHRRSFSLGKIAFLFFW